MANLYRIREKTTATGDTTVFKMSTDNVSGLSTVATSGSYNDLSNIPVISQDLTASGFTPVANVYYKHTGTTTASYTNGVIYYYNGTGYAALDGSASSSGPSQFSDIVVMTEAEFSEAYLAGTLQDDKLYLIEGETGTVNFVSTADHIVYNNANSGLTATNLQGAVDEINNKLFCGSYNDLTDKPSELTKEALLILLQLTSEQLTKLIAFADKITVDSTGVKVSGVLEATSFDAK